MRKLSLEKVMDDNLSKLIKKFKDSTFESGDISGYSVNKYLIEYMDEVAPKYVSKYLSDRRIRIEKASKKYGFDEGEFFVKFYFMPKGFESFSPVSSL